MTEFYFFIFYPILILIAGFFCLGFYIITQHQKVVEGDGKTRYYGKVFKRWSMFWLAETGTKRTYFRGLQLNKKKSEIERSHPKFKGRLSLDESGLCLNAAEGTVFTSDDIFAIEMANRVVVSYDSRDRIVHIFEEEPKYRFSEWVRMITGGCPPCMASCFFSLIYWVVYYTQPSIFQWSSHPDFAKYIYWIGYCICGSCINSIIHKRWI